MSTRNYRPQEGPLGKYRDPGETPARIPEVDMRAVANLNWWRNQTAAGPFLDELLGYYRFHPVTPDIARRYVGEPRAKAVGREAVRKMLTNKDDIIAAGQRQLQHIAENAEETLATFWAVASLREDAIAQVLQDIEQGHQPAEKVSAWAADSILDLGMCIKEPFTGKDWHKSVPRPPIIIPGAIRQLAPEAGDQITAFGLYASENHQALSTDKGVSLLEFALEEQDHRMQNWYSCHEALVEAFPGIPQSEDILLEHVPLDELLSIQKRAIGR